MDTWKLCLTREEWCVILTTLTLWSSLGCALMLLKDFLTSFYHIWLMVVLGTTWRVNECASKAMAIQMWDTTVQNMALYYVLYLHLFPTHPYCIMSHFLLFELRSLYTPSIALCTGSWLGCSKSVLFRYCWRNEVLGAKEICPQRPCC